MRKPLVMILLSAFMTLLTSPGICQQIQFGQTWLNQTLEGEKLPNALCTDFQFQLEAPDAGATYHARLHNDKLLWQRVTVGPRYKNVSLFYSLDLIPELNPLSGGGLRFVQTHGTGRSFEMMGGVYDRGFCFEGTIQKDCSGVIFRAGYEYRKLGVLRWFGPSVSLGVTW